MDEPLKEQRNGQLYDLMLQKGYPQEFSDLVACQMRTPYLAERMIAYVRCSGKVSPEEFADEMLAILAERDRLKDKHIAEHAQEKLNRLYRDGL